MLISIFRLVVLKITQITITFSIPSVIATVIRNVVPVINVHSPIIDNNIVTVTGI